MSGDLPCSQGRTHHRGVGAGVVAEEGDDALEKPSAGGKVEGAPSAPLQRGRDRVGRVESDGGLEERWGRGGLCAGLA